MDSNKSLLGTIYIQMKISCNENCTAYHTEEVCTVITIFFIFSLLSY